MARLPVLDASTAGEFREPLLAAAPAGPAAAAETRALGISVGDLVSLDPRTTITESGFIDDPQHALLTLEALGFCKRGEGGAFVSGQRTAPGGVFPSSLNAVLNAKSREPAQTPANQWESNQFDSESVKPQGRDRLA